MACYGAGVGSFVGDLKGGRLRMSLRHYGSRARGKIEAFHKAYECESWMFPNHQAFVDYWNCQRPHQALNHPYPAEAYFKDLRDTS